MENNAQQKRLFGRLIITLIAGLFIFANSAPSVAKSPKLKTVSISTSNSLPKVRPRFKIPNDPNQVMYLQRSMNANTIVYAVQYLDDGKIDPRNPVRVYWRRFNSGGEARALKYFERQVAFGVTVRKGAQPGSYSIEFKALKGRKITLRETGPYQVELIGKIGSHQVNPIYIYVDLDESGLIPKVIGLRFFGRDIDTGKYITEVISVSGGEIRQ
ncbi:MAG: DUF4833 domain-containing protein [Rhodobacterales bacterium]|nr:DUF4833 domain-containing protein [Rhodobacterales bacterium]